MMLDRLAEYEKERFEEEFADQNWYKGKGNKDIEAMEKARKRGKLSTPSSLASRLLVRERRSMILTLGK